MRTKTSGAADSIEATRQKLAAMPGVTGNGQIQDLWREYFLTLGIKGNLRDQMNVFLSGKAQSQFKGHLPVLFNNFAYGHTSPGFTFTRDSETNGWVIRRTDDYILKDFVIDQPAFVIDPATGQALGYRALQGTTNEILNSEDITASSWLKSSSGTGSDPAITANAGVAPDGTSTADRVVYSLNGGGTDSDSSRLTSNGISIGSGEDWTVSVWIKSNTSSDYQLEFSLAGVGKKAITVTPSWQRFSTTWSNTSSGSFGARLNFFGDTATTDSADVLVWGAQGEQYSFALGYIKTEGTTVSTAADDATEPLPASCQDGFVWVVHARVPEDSSADKWIGTISDDSNNNRIGLRVASGGEVNFVFKANGGNTTSIGTETVSAGSTVKIACRARQDDFALSVNGNPVESVSSQDFPSGLDTKNIGDFVASVATSPYNSTIAYDALHDDPENWTDADLQAATS